MLPIQITIKDMENSKALESHIEKKALRLSKFHRKIQRCHVVIHIPQKHKQHGKLYSVHIDITIPGKELTVNRQIDEDVYIAIRDAFIAAERQLEAHIRKLRSSGRQPNGHYNLE
ncbi:MAG: ribosome-associated translation inhibitor RaiA [Gammaproteobacteria bacterium]|nr:ribosome-associated translation inhibitor RaiA [Gammaproteobacteria bacterium]